MTERVAMKRKRNPDWFACPHCGADVQSDAKVCRNCGSDDETGWSEDADVWGAGIDAGYGDDDDFDYDEFVERELPEHATAPPGKLLKRWAWRAIVALVCIALLRAVLVRWQ
jgi:ribosomal protein L40E